MSVDQTVDLARLALTQTVIIAMPVLVAAAVVGLVVALIQTLTQVQDQTVTFVPKLVAIFGVLAVMMPWFLESMIAYTRQMIETAPQTVMGM